MNTDLVNAVRSPDAIIPFEGLVESGLLWWINKRAFHTEGRAIELQYDEAGTAIGFRLVGDGFQAITHDYDTNQTRSEAFEAVMMPNDSKPEVIWYGQGLD